MCGRFSFSLKKEKIKKTLQIEVETPLRFSYNIAPTHEAYVLTSDQAQELQRMEWGLVPHWSRDGRNTGKLINARSEGIASKPSFRMPVRHRRCVVLADSFYEWRKEGSRKIPYRILTRDGSPLLMAGIWDQWTDGFTIKRTFSIITTTPNQEMQSLHNRMPVFLDTSEKLQSWLEETNLDIVLSLLQPVRDDYLNYYRVSDLLNSPSNNGADLHREVEEPLTLF